MNEQVAWAGSPEWVEEEVTGKARSALLSRRESEIPPTTAIDSTLKRVREREAEAGEGAELVGLMLGRARATWLEEERGKTKLRNSAQGWLPTEVDKRRAASMGEEGSTQGEGEEDDEEPSSQRAAGSLNGCSEDEAFFKVLTKAASSLEEGELRCAAAYLRRVAEDSEERVKLVEERGDASMAVQAHILRSSALAKLLAFTFKSKSKERDLATLFRLASLWPSSPASSAASSEAARALSTFSLLMHGLLLRGEQQVSLLPLAGAWLSPDLSPADQLQALHAIPSAHARSLIVAAIIERALSGAEPSAQRHLAHLRPASADSAMLAAEGVRAMAHNKLSLPKALSMTYQDKDRTTAASLVVLAVASSCYARLLPKGEADPSLLDSAIASIRKGIFSGNPSVAPDAEGAAAVSDRCVRLASSIAHSLRASSV